MSNEQLDRIEAKLDAILDALDGGVDEGPETVVVQTMDGQRIEVEAGAEFL